MKRIAIAMTLLASSAAAQPAAGPNVGTTTAASAPSGSLEDQLKVAQAQAKSGHLLLTKKDYSGARPLLEGAFALLPTGATLVDLVQCYRALSLNAPALQAILQARAAGVSLNPAETKAIDKDVAELTPITSRVRLITPVPPTSLRIDGVVTTLPVNSVPLVLEPKLHAVQIECPGYEPYTKDLTTVAGKDEQLVAELQLWVNTGHLKVTDKSGQVLDVTVDGKVVGQTPWEGDLPVGSHTVQGRNKRAVATAATLELPRRGAVEVTLQSVIQYERVSVQVAPPSATVTLDGQRITVPYEDYLLLGQHQLNVEAPGYAPQERLFTLGVDTPFVEGISLEPAARMESPPEIVPEPNPFRIGPLVGIIGLPRPVNVEIFAKPNDWFGVGAGFSMVPELTIRDISGKMNAFNAVGRVFPFAGSFYVGAGVGVQTLSIKGSDNVEGEDLTAAADHSAFFVTPQVGWLWTWDSGFTVGINIGVQVALTSTPKVEVRDPRGEVVDPADIGPDAVDLNDDVHDAAKIFGKYPLPAIDLLKLGFLF